MGYDSQLSSMKDIMKVRNIAYLTFITALLHCNAAFGGVVTQTNAFAVIVRQREPELRQLLAVNDVSVVALSAKAELEDSLARPDSLENADAVQRFLTSVISLGVRVGGTGEFVRNDTAVACLVQALTYPDREVREIAQDRLEQITRASEYRAYVTQLIAAWRQNSSFELLDLIAMTHTAEGNAFLRHLQAEHGFWATNWLEEISADLGEPGVEGRLIKRFLSETNAQAKCDLALTLGRIGSTNAVLALVKELRTPLMVEKNTGRLSVRAKIIEALGLAFPESRLFNEELQEVRHNSSGNEQSVKERQAPYIEKVERWCQERFGITWQRERPDEPLFTFEPFFRRR